MNSIKLGLITLLACLGIFFSSNAFAFEVPTPTGFATDTTGKLTASQLSTLNARLETYSKISKNEIGILMVPSLGGDNLDDVTHQVFKSYRVGKAGLDNGVLLFVSINDHKMRLQTGKGVEGDITDLQANDILVSMRPFFRANDFNGGLNKAVDGIQARLESRTEQKADPGVGQKFNQPVSGQATSNNSGGCQVGAVGNSVGFGVGLFAMALLLGVMLTRYLMRRHAQNSMLEIEKRVEKELEDERLFEAQVAAEKKLQAEYSARRNAQMEMELQAERNAIALKDASKSKPISVRTVKAKPMPSILKPTIMVVPRPTPKAQKVEATSKQTDMEDVYKSNLAREAQRAENDRIEAAERASREESARRQRERDEEDRKRRQREDDDRASSYSSSSSSSSDWGGSSGGSDSGFGGGDSGGGGSDSSW